MLSVELSVSLGPDQIIRKRLSDMISRSQQVLSCADRDDGGSRWICSGAAASFAPAHSHITVGKGQTSSSRRLQQLVFSVGNQQYIPHTGRSDAIAPPDGRYRATPLSETFVSGCS